MDLRDYQDVNVEEAEEEVLFDDEEDRQDEDKELLRELLRRFTLF